MGLLTVIDDVPLYDSIREAKTWAKQYNLTGYHAILSKHNSAYEMNIQDGHLRFEVRDSSGAAFRGRTVSLMNSGQYYHVSAVRNGPEIKLYINGESQTVEYFDAATSLPINTNTYPVMIGRRSNESLYFDGVIDEVAVFDQALSYGEIQDIIEQTALMATGSWRFNEGSGSTVADSSGNSNGGTLYNGTSWTAGVHGYAAEFDGINDYINIADSPSLDISGNEYSVAA